MSCNTALSVQREDKALSSLVGADRYGARTELRTYLRT